MAGIDAPEISRIEREPGQPYSQHAKRYLAGLILNKVVEIKGYGLDQNNRILGVIYLNGKDINLEMVRAGLAEVYRGKSPGGLNLNPFWHAQEEARLLKRGMWIQGENYVSPKEWREMHKGDLDQ